MWATYGLGLLSQTTSDVLDYDTTADFDTGIYSGTMGESDNLYGGLFEDFADGSLNSVFTMVKNSGTQTISGGNLAIAIQNHATTYSYLYHNSSHTWADMRKFSAHFVYSAGTYQISTRPCMYVTSKATAPNALNIGTELIKCMVTTRGSPYNDDVCSMTVNETSGNVNEISTGGFPRYTSDIIWEVLSDGTELTLNLYNGSTGTLVTTATVAISDITNDGNPLWFVIGEVGLSLTATIDDITMVDENTNWLSPSNAVPTDKKLASLTFTLTNGEAGNGIDKVEILDSSDDSVIDTASTDITSTTTIYSDSFDNRLVSTYNTPFKIKVYFKNLATADLFTDNRIQGTFETLAYVRTDGEVFST